MSKFIIFLVVIVSVFVLLGGLAPYVPAQYQEAARSRAGYLTGGLVGGKTTGGN